MVMRLLVFVNWEFVWHSSSPVVNIIDLFYKEKDFLQLKICIEFILS